MTLRVALLILCFVSLLAMVLVADMQGAVTGAPLRPSSRWVAGFLVLLVSNILWALKGQLEKDSSRGA